ncbi:MAG TPA: hypothetical protein LFW14_00130 [Rickettsia endosymbiont of Degeeriella rufa]|nr:hypothetical protein [Rickettsia endosymbiont of Columbicola hoogstraali]HJD62019.1 hypothetical protein [Rickettsia endosymbiont of Degeeriella rufa]
MKPFFNEPEEKLLVPACAISGPSNFIFSTSLLLGITTSICPALFGLAFLYTDTTKCPWLANFCA